MTDKKNTHEQPQRQWRRGRKPSPQLTRPDFPYVMRLRNGKMIYVEIPGRWTTEDRDGQTAFLPPAVRFMDRLRALATSLDRPPSPGFVTALREGLGLTQRQMGERIGVNRLTVSRWERGELRPGAKSVAAMEKLRQEAVRQGVTLAA